MRANPKVHETNTANTANIFSTNHGHVFQSMMYLRPRDWALTYGFEIGWRLMWRMMSYLIVRSWSILFVLSSFGFIFCLYTSELTIYIYYVPTCTLHPSQLRYLSNFQELFTFPLCPTPEANLVIIDISTRTTISTEYLYPDTQSCRCMRLSMSATLPCKWTLIHLKGNSKEAANAVALNSIYCLKPQCHTSYVPAAFAAK